MSLASAIAQTVRPRLPESVLRTCLDADRAVVENIALVALEYVSGLNIPLSSLKTHNSCYELRVPITMDKFQVSLMDLRGIQAHSPSRVSDVMICKDKDSIELYVKICDETSMIRFTELDVIRLQKRSRF